MNSSLLDVLMCPNCGSTDLAARAIEGTPADIEEGFVWCGNRHWFPIEARVLEFLPPDLQYRADRDEFRRKYATALQAETLFEEADAHAAAHTPDELSLIQVQQQHFDWYADNDTQAYNAYATMPFWKIVDARTFRDWNAAIRARRNAADNPKLLLDVGCAQGRSTLQVVQPGVRVIGFDISKRLARQAYANFRQLRGTDLSGDFLVADGSRFPFRSSAFDCVLVYGVLHHLPDPAAACREVARVLKTGGVYFGSENNRTIFRGAFEFLQKIAALWHEEAGAQPLMSAREMVQWFSGSGLQIKTESIVFVPPHLVNVLGLKAGRLAVAASDAVFHAIPFLKEQGGLLLIHGAKG